MDNNNLDELLTASSWDDRSGAEIREFLQGYLSRLTTQKPGHFALSTEPMAEDGCYRIYGFAGKAAYDEWSLDPEGKASLLLTSIKLPEIKNSLEPTTKVNLERPTGDGDIITTTDNVVIRVRFTSKIFDPADSSSTDTNEGGKLRIETRSSDEEAWVEQGRINIQSVPTANTDSWTELDIARYLASGEQQVRISATGNDTLRATRGIIFNVTKAKITISSRSNWWVPVTDGVLDLDYAIEGKIDKRLNIRVDGGAIHTWDIGKAEYTETTLNIKLGAASLGHSLSHGVHKVEAWLSVGASTRSAVVKSQHMVVANDSDTDPYVLINDLLETPQNWAETTLFAYSVYDPAGEVNDLRLTLTSFNGSKNYLTVNLGTPTPNKKYTFRNVLEVESDDSVIAGLYHFFNGTEEITTPVEITLDNSGKFSPASGYGFALNPRNRSNEEASPRSIINQADGSTVTSQWTDVSLTADGWTADANGTRCLRLLAGSSVAIDYEAFKDYSTGVSENSVTIELDFAARNVTKEDASIIRICRDGDTPRGLEVFPSSARFLTEKAKNASDQATYFAPEERTHLTLNLVHGINGTEVNIARLLVKGIVSREFKWDDNDTINDGRGTQGIRIGSDGADIDIYNIRVYHRALSSYEVLNNYISTLPTTEEKQRLRKANDILSGGSISYDLASKVLPTMLWKIADGDHLPRYGDDGKTYEVHCPETVIGRIDSDGAVRWDKLTDWFLMGQGTSSMTYYGWNIAMNPKAKKLQAHIDAGTKGKWIDSNGDTHSAVFALDPSLPEANKLVAKANWASSQQSHKMGCVNAFHDLWKAVTGGSNITKTPGFEKCRVAVKQDVFLGFVQVGNGEPRFTGIYTFGPGKGDKATFGCNTTKFPHYLMIEGCDNGEPLTNHHIPWDDDVTYADEVYKYNGSKQWELCIGDVANINRFKEAFNFVYLNSPNIHPFVGNYSQLCFATGLNQRHLYWVTQTSDDGAAYDLYRYDAITSGWVNAGINKARVNMLTDLGISLSSTDLSKGWDYVNSLFLAARVARFKAGAANYFNVDDALYHLCSVLLHGASDNRAKNTYPYLDLDDSGNAVIRFAQDDLDTIKRTDNEGRLVKPYYVETLDLNPDGAPYWNGKDNAMYLLFELAYPAERRNMMNRILSAMTSLAGSPEAFMRKYFTSIQERIPAVAYNETARVRYEAAAVAWDNRQYSASIHPLIQSVGSQQDAERHWDAERIDYLSAYCCHGKYTPNGSDGLVFRSLTTKSGGLPSFTFNLKAAKWTYPSVSVGSSVRYGEGNDAPRRLPAGETMTLKAGTTDGNTNIKIHAVSSYESLGNFGGKSIGSTFELFGSRLTEFDASGVTGEFRPTAFASNALNLRALNLNGCQSITGSLDLKGHTRLVSVDLRGTDIDSLSIPSNASLQTIRYGAATKAVTLADFPNLSTVDIQDYSNIETFSVANCPQVDVYELVKTVVNGSDKLYNISCKGVEWTNVPLDFILRLADIKAKITGRITLATSATVDFDTKRRLVAAWGDVDSGVDGLQIVYNGKAALDSFTITAPKVVMTASDVQLVIVPNSNLANQFKGFSWRISSNPYATITPDGVMKVTEVANNGTQPKVTVTATALRSDGSTVEASCEIGLYYRAPQPGDKVYSDGSYSDTLDPSKQLIGLCFWVDRDKADVPGNRLMLGVETIGSFMWGIRYTNTLMLSSGEYAVIDLPDLPNITGNDGSITEANYRLSVNPDVFIYYAQDTPMGQIGFKAVHGNFAATFGEIENGTTVPVGMWNTIQIIRHRDFILTGLSKQIPRKDNSEGLSISNHLTSLIAIAAMDGPNYPQLYYPAASYCYHYEPTITSGRQIDERFQAGHWWLPSSGELLRFSYYYKYTSLFDDVKALLSNLNESHHSSSEISGNHIWNVNPIEGTYFGYGRIYKNQPCRIRPACAF